MSACNVTTTVLTARPFASLDEVEAPDGVAPSTKFTVLLASSSKQRGFERKECWAGSGAQPVIVSRQSQAVAGKRHALRPSARAAASPHAIDDIVTQDLDIACWSSTTARMPFELKEEDAGWLAGPVGGPAGRPIPPFAGAKHGPTSALPRGAGARRIMQEVQFTGAFKRKAVLYAQQHERAWLLARKQPGAPAGTSAGAGARARSKRSSISRAFNGRHLREEHIELWLAVRIRISMLNPAIPVKDLWDGSKIHTYDAQLDAACPYRVYLWLNRHISFGEYGEGGAAGAQDAAAPTGFDRYGKRRELSDIARTQASKPYHPRADIGIDDGIRPTRHLDGTRQRHKAAVHTGRPFDSLNDASSHYFINWEEQGWLQNAATTNAAAIHTPTTGNPAGVGTAPRAARRGDGDSDSDSDSDSDRNRDNGGGSGGGGGADGGADGVGVNALEARVLRLVSALPQHKGYRVWLDRGYGKLAVAQALHDRGFYSTSIMMENRIGLPRRYFALLKKRMQCPRKCQHNHDSPGCMLWSWTVVHKGTWELQIWNAGKVLIVALTDCTSAVRTVQVVRTLGRRCFSVAVPEAIGRYSLYGRSATDGGDQARKRLGLAARRQLRQGPKGALFDAEIAFVNGAIICTELRRKHVTTWEFCYEFMSEVLGSVSARQKKHEPLQVARLNTRASQSAHAPIDFVEANRAKRKRGEEGSASRDCGRGRTCCASTCAPGLPQRPRIFCKGCSELEGCSGWFHFECYVKAHAFCLKV